MTFDDESELTTWSDEDLTRAAQTPFGARVLPARMPIEPMLREVNRDARRVERTVAAFEPVFAMEFTGALGRLAGQRQAR